MQNKINMLNLINSQMGIRDCVNAIEEMIIPIAHSKTYLS